MAALGAVIAFLVLLMPGLAVPLGVAAGVVAAVAAIAQWLWPGGPAEHHGAEEGA
ncbi:hypothetical protein QA802_23250 [Streptomyces sp. B21-105]|uniref:hypothetical protein n=1 Tax=Streptomyces sp. B21-105 TaxID=3039417 RepID=UPI002FF350C7